MQEAKSDSTRHKLELVLWALGSLVAAVYAYVI